MPKRKTLTNKLDALSSLYTRARNNFTCERCHKQYDPKSRALHNSHYMGRTNRATRWLEDNLDALCHGCHSYFEDRKQTMYRDWKIEKHGKKRVDEIEALSRTVAKFTDSQLKEMIIDFKNKLDVL